MLRWKENDERPKAASQLREALNTYLTQAQSDDEKYSHIESADKEKVVSINHFWSMVQDADVID